MLAEIKHSQDDKLIMKQYADSDQVVDNGKVFKVQSEVVLPLSDSHQLITRSVIRLQAKYHHSDMCKSIGMLFALFFAASYNQSPVCSFPLFSLHRSFISHFYAIFLPDVCQEHD